MYNEDQIDHMRSLAAADPATNCWCGWYPLGECISSYQCNTKHPGKSAKDKRDEELQ